MKPPDHHVFSPPCWTFGKLTYCRHPCPSMRLSFCYIFSLHIPQYTLYTHVFQKSMRHRSMGQKSVKCKSKPYSSYSPWRHYLCYLWAPAGFLPLRLSWNILRALPGTVPPTLPGPPFIPATIFKTAGIQSKHVTFLRSILLKPKVAFLVFCPLYLVMRQV